MTPCAPFATTYAETLEYPCGLYDRSIVLPPGNATVPITVAVSISVAHPSASTNFRESPYFETSLYVMCLGEYASEGRGPFAKGPDQSKRRRLSLQPTLARAAIRA